MKSKHLCWVMAALILSLCSLAMADGGVTRSVKASGVQDFVQATAFNGNWLGMCLGCPANSSDEASVAKSKEDGRAMFSAIKKQKQARDDAKAKGPNNYLGIANSAFWTSGVVWAYNNAGFAKLKGSEDKKAAAEAADYFDKAIVIAMDSPKLGKPVNDAQAEAFKAEAVNLKKAEAAAKKNLLYCQRVMGEKPWPVVPKVKK